MLAELLATDVLLFMLVFARIGSAIMVLPGFGEVTVTARVRLAVALALSFVLLPVVSVHLPTLPQDSSVVLLLLGGEILIGLAIGMVGRLLITSLQIGGTIIAFNTGLGSAQMFDPAAQQQGAITSAFLTTLGVTLLFVTNLHHLMLVALADSYVAFVPGAPLPLGDFADLAAQLVAKAFRLGMQMAMPILIVSMVIYIGMGLMARLMPQIQVFFIALPIQLLAGFLILGFTLTASMLLFLEEFRDAFATLFIAG